MRRTSTVVKGRRAGRGSSLAGCAEWTATLGRAIGGLAALTVAGGALAGPQGEQVVRGDVRFERRGAETLIYAGRNSIINYRSFDVARGETVRFVQPDAASRVLNRINSAAPTRIDGNVFANGRVYFVNPAGVYFGQGSVINAAAIYAGAAQITDRDFLGNVDRFANARGSVVNDGTIVTDFAALLGRHVENNGTIIAPQGTIVMAAGNDFLVRERQGNVTVKVAGTALAGGSAGVVNAGEARGKTVSMAAGDVLGMAMLNAGTIEARTVRLEGQGRGEVANTGTIDASSATGMGGDVRVLGEYVGIRGGSIDASGAAGGGTVLVGGGERGAGERSARGTYLASDASVRADATGSGVGGRVVLWSSEVTNVAGEVSARGVDAGGFVETSSKGELRVARTPDVTATAGKAGTWLIDPRNVTIVAGAGNTNINAASPFSPTGDDAQLGVDLIVAALNGGASVLIDTSTGGSQAGDITLATNLDFNGTGNGTLTLSAHNNIVINGTISDSVAGGDSLRLVLIADSDANGSGDVSINQAIALSTADLTVSGVNFSNAAGGTIDAGTVTLTHTGNVVFGGDVRATASLSAHAGTDGTGNVSFASAGVALSSPSIALRAGDGAGGAGSAQVGLTTNAPSIRGLGGGGTSPTSFSVRQDAPITDVGTLAASAFGGGVTGMAYALRSDDGAVTVSTGSKVASSLLSLTGTSVNIGTDVAPGSLSVTGPATLAGNVNAGAGSVSFSGTLALGSADRTITGGTVSLGGAVSSTGGGLTLTNSGTATIGGAVTLTGTGAFVQNGTGAVTLNAGITTNNQDIVFSGAVTVGGSLNLSAGTGTIDFNNALALGNASVTMTGDEIDFAGADSVTGSGATLVLQPSANSVSIGVGGGAGTLDISAGDLAALSAGFGTLTIGRAGGTHAIAIAGTTFRDPVAIRGGAITTSGNLVGTGSASIALAGSTIALGGNVTTAGQAITLTGDKLLGGATRTLTGSAITLDGGTVSSTGGGLTIANSGLFTLDGGAVALTGAGAFTLSGAGAAQVNAGISTQNQNIVFAPGAGAIAFGAGSFALDAGTGAVILGRSASFGAGAYTIRGSGIDFTAGADSVTGVSGTTLALRPGLDSDSIGLFGGAGTLALSAADLAALADGFGGIVIGSATGTGLVTVNAGTFRDAVTIRSGGTGGQILLTGSLAGTGDASVTLVGGSPTVLNGNITTSGQAITIVGGLALGGSGTYLLDTTAGGAPGGANITVTGATNATSAGLGELDLKAGGGDIAMGVVGDATRLFAVRVVSARNADFGATSADFFVQDNGSGATTFAGALTAGQAVSLNGTRFNLRDVTVNGGFGVVVNNSGPSSLTGNIQSEGPVSFGGGATTLSGNIVTTSDAVTFNGNVILAGAVGITTANGPVTFERTIDGGQALGISAGSGVVVFNGAVGGTTAPTSVTVYGSGRVDVNEAMRAGGIQLVTAGDLRFSSDLTATTGAINLQAGSDGTGGFTFFTPGTSFRAGTVNLWAGDGAGGPTGAFIDLSSNAPTFRGAAGGATSPTFFSLRQDAAIDDARIPAAALFGGGVVGMSYTLRSDDGSITVATPAKVNGSNLALIAPTIAVNDYLVLTGFNAYGDLTLGTDLATNNSGNIGVFGLLTLTGPATTLYANGGLVTLNGGVAAGTSRLTIVGDDVALAGTIAGTGDLVIQPGTASRAIVIGGTSAGALSLDTAELDALADGWGSITIGRTDGTGGISTGSDVTFRDPVTLLSPGGGTTTIGHAIRGIGNGGVTIDGFGTLTLTNDIVTQGGAIVIRDDVRLGANVTLDTTNSLASLDGGDVTVSGTIDADAASNGRTLTVNAGSLGTARLDHAIGGTQALESVDVTGGALVLAAVTTRGGQRYVGSATLTDSLRSTVGGTIRLAGDARISSDLEIRTAGNAGDRIVVLGGFDSLTAGQEHALTLNSGSGRIDVTANSGFRAALGTFTATAAAVQTASVAATGAVAFNGGATLIGNASGSTVHFNGTLELGGNSVVTGTTSVLFSGTVNSRAGQAFNLGVVSPQTTFAAAVGDGVDAQLGTLATTGATTISGGVVRTTMLQTYGGAVRLTTDLLASSGSGGITFASTLNTDGVNRDLTINTPGETFFGGRVGETGALSTLILTGGGSARVAGGGIRTNNSQTYGGAVLLDQDATFAGDGIVFSDRVDSGANGAKALIATGGAGGVQFGAGVGLTESLSAINLTGDSIALRAVRTTGGQTYTGPATLRGDLTSTDGGVVALSGAVKVAQDVAITTAGSLGDNVTFGGPVDALTDGHALTVTAGQGTVNFSGDVGLGTGTNDRALSNLTVQASAIDVRAVRTSGSQVLSGAASLRGNLTSTGAGAIAVDGPAMLFADVTVTTNNGGVTFGGAIDSDSTARALSVVTGGNSLKRFAGAIGNASRLSTLTVNNDGRARFEGGLVRTNGNQRFDSAVVLAASTTFESPNVTFGSSIDSDAVSTPRALVVNTAAGGADGVVTFGGVLGGTTALERVQTAGTGKARIGANITTTSGVDFAGPVKMLATSVIDGGTGAMTFRGAIDTETSLAPAGLIVVSRGTSTIDGALYRFGGSIGATSPLASLSIGPDLSASPAVATIVFSDGFDTQGRVLASSFAATDSFTINTTGDFTMGRGQKLTSFGRLRMNVGGTAMLGDLVSLADIQLTATAIRLRLRPGGSVTDNFLGTTTDNGVDFVAAGQINFSVAPTVEGSGGSPIFANNAANGSATLGGFSFRQFQGGVKTSLFRDTRAGNSTFLLPLDLKAQGPSTTQLATSLAGVLPRDVSVGVTDIAPPISASQEQSLSEMGIRARDLTVEETIDLLAGRSLFDDLKPRSGMAPEQYSVASSRLSAKAVDRAVRSYKDLVSVPGTDATGAATTRSRIPELKQAFASAWASYASRVPAPTGLGYRAYLETRGAQATRDEARALEFLDGARDVVENIKGIGLSEFETSIPRRKLLEAIRPETIPTKEFLEAVVGRAGEMQ